MRRTETIISAQRVLDARFKDMRPASRFARPVRGWIQAIREALGMSATQLGTRLGISQPGIFGIERSEQRGTIELRTLQRVAEALDCTLIYALVPNRPLEATVRERARALARRKLAATQHSMTLENQGLSAEQNEAQLDILVEALDPRLLWDES